MEYEITDYITPEEYMEMRRLVAWPEFPLEQAAECLNGLVMQTEIPEMHLLKGDAI